MEGIILLEGRSEKMEINAETIYEQTRESLNELLQLDRDGLNHARLLVIGASSSEIAGGVLGQRQDDMWPFDPAVLVDDDGRIHLYAGQGPLNEKMAKQRAKTHKFTNHMELELDMMTLKTQPEPLLPNVTNSAGTGFETHEFFEASSIRKIQGRYYLIYSSLTNHELCYAVSSRPDGDFRYGGVVISNCDLFPGKDGKPLACFGNNHGGLEEINGKYYIFYHRETNRSICSRQGCAEEVKILPDGTIPQVEMTSCGLNGGPLKAEGSFPAGIACLFVSIL